MKPADMVDIKMTWSGDNRLVMTHVIIPNLRLSTEDKRVMIWAYESGYEIISDGETCVADMFLDGVIKDPAGVVHDAINRVPLHITPYDARRWTCAESNALYRRIKKALGAGFRHRWRRWLGLTLAHYIYGLDWWR